ncbi:MAG: hypothetical protein KAX23_00695 [Dehalococcoidia bacterium]|nr:hypothetical protein [Chloroflexota bacterium]MCK4242044.1 hypothetical protein [Dehalococcoidia bacterium]
MDVFLTFAVITGVVALVTDNHPWKYVHVGFAAAVVVAILAHVYLNRKALLSYFRRRSRS